MQPSILVDLRFRGPVADRETRLPKDEVDLTDSHSHLVEGWKLTLQLLRNRKEYLRDLSLLDFPQADKLIVQFDGLERLDKYGLPRRRKPMNYPGNCLSVVIADRNNIAIVADGNELFL